MLIAAGPAAASPKDLYGERSIVVALADRCRLFDDETRAALVAGQLQARGAALRASASQADLEALRLRSEVRARQVPCGSTDVTEIAARVRSGFTGYARLNKASYPGDLSAWTAVRRSVDGWQLQQTVQFARDRMRFGLIKSTGLVAEGQFADGARPFSARLILRDDARTVGPYLDSRSAPPGRPMPLNFRIPPRSASRIFAATLREPAASAWRFRFPEAAQIALARLDPREALIVEFVFAGRSEEVVRQALIEVGDFAAGQAFIQVSSTSTGVGAAPITPVSRPGARSSC